LVTAENARLKKRADPVTGPGEILTEKSIRIENLAGAPVCD